MTYAEYEKIESEIRACENLLSQTDYIAMKLAEGACSTDEYAETIAKRQTWRKTIHNLRDQIDGVTPEDPEE